MICSTTNDGLTCLLYLSIIENFKFHSSIIMIILIIFSDIISIVFIVLIVMVMTTVLEM